MIELKLNSSVMAMQSRSQPKYEWYTAEVNNIFTIHIHNMSGEWTYEIVGVQEIEQSGFESKEDAFDAAIIKAKGLLKLALKKMEE